MSCGTHYMLKCGSDGEIRMSFGHCPRDEMRSLELRLFLENLTYREAHCLICSQLMSKGLRQLQSSARMSSSSFLHCQIWVRSCPFHQFGKSEIHVVTVQNKLICTSASCLICCTRQYSSCPDPRNAKNKNCHFLMLNVSGLAH